MTAPRDGDARVEAVRRRPGMPILVACAAMGPFALNIFLPSMPGLQVAFATDYSNVQLGITLFLIGFALAQLVHGPLSDRFGRRPVMLAGIALYSAGAALCLFAPSIEALVAGRVVQAVGGCAGLVLTRAIVRDLYEREQAVSRLAYVTMAMVVAPMIAPGLGGLLEEWAGWRASYALLLGLGVILLVAGFFVMHETRAAGAAAGGVVSGAGFRVLLGRRAFHGYAWQTTFATAVYMAFISGAPDVTVRVLGHSPGAFGLFMIAVAGSYMLGNLIAGRISGRVGTDRMISIGSLVSLVGAGLVVAAGAAGAVTAATLFGAMAVVAVGNGLSIPNGLAGVVSVEPTLAGAASGLSGFLQMAVAAAVSYLVGLGVAGGPMPMAAIMLAAAALSWGAHLLVPGRK